jgi:hypothetical protein
VSIGEEASRLEHDTGAVSSVNRYHPAVSRPGGRKQVGDSLYPESMTETFAASSESDLKFVDPDRLRGIDDEHHAGVALKDGHLGVRQIAAKLHQHTGKRGDNTGPVSAYGGHHITGHPLTQARQEVDDV